MPSFHLRPPLCSRNVSMILGARRATLLWLPSSSLATSSTTFAPIQNRWSTSASSTRWKSRQFKDQFAREAKVQGLMSRAAFKLLEMNQKYRIFKPGNTVVDLGYAPGSWSQVAISRTHPRGRVLGIDIIPAQPPKGVSTIQGNFLDPTVQAEVRAYVQDPERGRVRRDPSSTSKSPNQDEHEMVKGFSEEEVDELERGYVDLERSALPDSSDATTTNDDASSGVNGEGSESRLSKRKKEPKSTAKLRDAAAGRVVDVVLSDMSEPWDQTTGFWQNSISDPYRRMMNTSGNTFKDHAGSMDLCMAGLTFCYDTLRTGGHFVCKFYQGAEDKSFENRLRRLFEKVHREKPESSRKESKEAYFVALRRRELPTKEEILG